MTIVFCLMVLVILVIANVCGYIAIKDLLNDHLIWQAIVAIVLTIIHDIGLITFYIVFFYGDPWG